ncbi:unnamed protein product [Hymenolepis diminuta]|uniref:Parvo_NS1 domain-containing protein n=1 Tax=Hymenolepis diminuta TaxID=6216 RepID=A0A0R3SMH5_HYMDI|nr:unnamed protein product [Hymenolepis diminuta]
MGKMERREEAPISTRLDAENTLANVNIPVARIHDSDQRYYSFVIRGYTSLPINISCIYVEHDDHLHVLFKCSGNVGRKMERILRDAGVPISEWYQAKMTKIIVNNPVKMIQYFKFRNTPVIIGAELRDIFEIARSMPPLETAEQCYGIQLRTQTKAALNNKVDNRVSKYESLYEELKRRGVRDFDDMYTIFTVHEIMHFNANIGLQWREIAKQAIQAINREDLLLEQTRTYLENLQEKRHDCYADSEENIQRGVDWLEFMFNMNHIPVYALLTDIIKIMDMKVNKVNCLCFYGQTNTGKTLLANLITSHLTVSDHNLFYVLFCNIF